MFYAIIIGALTAKESEAWVHPKLTNMHFHSPAQLLSCKPLIPRLDALVVQATTVQPEVVRQLSAAYPQALVFISHCDSKQAQTYLDAGVEDVIFASEPFTDSRARTLAHLQHRAIKYQHPHPSKDLAGEPQKHLPLRLLPTLS